MFDTFRAFCPTGFYPEGLKYAKPGVVKLPKINVPATNRLRGNAAARTIPIALWTYARFSTVGFIFLSLAWSQTLKQTLPPFDPAICIPFFQSHWLFKLKCHAPLTRHSPLHPTGDAGVRKSATKIPRLPVISEQGRLVLLFHLPVTRAEFAGPRSLRDRHTYAAPPGLLYLNPLNLAIVHVMNF